MYNLESNPSILWHVFLRTLQQHKINFGLGHEYKGMYFMFINKQVIFLTVNLFWCVLYELMNFDEVKLETMNA